MNSEIDWEERKQALCTAENLRLKITLLFPGQDVEKIEAMVSDAGQWSHVRLSLSILRCVELAGKAGDLAFLSQVIEVAREDYRDILVRDYWQEAHLPFSTSEEEKQAAREDDVREYLDWLIWGI